MRTKTYIIIIIINLLLPFVSTSCTNEEEQFAPDVYVTFKPANAIHTRTDGYTTPFSVWVHSLPEGEKWQNTLTHPATLLENTTITYDNGTWQPAPHLYWPKDRALTIHAITPPSDKNSFSTDKGVTIEGFDVRNGIYPSITGTIADCNRRNNSGCIPLLFKSTLSKIEIEARSIAPSDTIIRLKSLLIDNIACKGDFQSLPAPEWKCSPDTYNLQFLTSPTTLTTKTTTIGNRIALPQHIPSPITLTIDICDKDGNTLVAGRTITTDPINDIWSIGKYHIYSISVDTDTAMFSTDIINRLR